MTNISIQLFDAQTADILNGTTAKDLPPDTPCIPVMVVQVAAVKAAQVVVPPVVKPPTPPPSGMPTYTLKTPLDGGPPRYAGIAQKRVIFKFSGGANFCQMSTNPSGYSVPGVRGSTYWNMADGPVPADIAQFKRYGGGGIRFAPGDTLVVDVPAQTKDRTGYTQSVDLVVQQLR